MYLGLFGPGPNPSACFVDNGNILFWAEEERFTRIKTSPNSFPFQSIFRGLKSLNITLKDIKGIGYAWDCKNYAEQALNNLRETQLIYPSSSDYLNKLAQDNLNIRYDPIKIETYIRRIFTKENISEIPPIKFFPHHLCHAASTLVLNPLKEGVIILNDGAGEIISTSIHYYDGNSISEPMKTIFLPNSLGSIYASLTEYLGYRAYEDEGRVMGLSCYGEYDKEIHNNFLKILKPLTNEDNFYYSDPTFRYNHERSYGNRFSDKMVDLLGKPRDPNESPLDKRFKNIAFSLQSTLEEILINMSDWAQKETNSEVCFFAGGVHMNCKANGEIVKSNIFKECYFQPASSDNGVSLGAALLAENKDKQKSFAKLSILNNLYYGSSYEDKEILELLKKAKVKFRFSENISEEAAESISNNKLIGWFQGRMEIGARSLGGRSILTNPLSAKARDLVNLNVKNREKWRPFCPSVKEEYFEKYFEGKLKSSNPFYMIVAYDVKKSLIKKIPSCVHIDNTARPQAVSKKSNLKYWKLLDHLEKIQKHPVVLNTSFNVKGEPIVESPEQALRCFFSTGLDELYLGSYIVTKK